MIPKPRPACGSIAWGWISIGPRSNRRGHRQHTAQTGHYTDALAWQAHRRWRARKENRGSGRRMITRLSWPQKKTTSGGAGLRPILESAKERIRHRRRCRARVRIRLLAETIPAIYRLLLKTWIRFPAFLTHQLDQHSTPSTCTRSQDFYFTRIRTSFRRSGPGVHGGS